LSVRGRITSPRRALDPAEWTTTGVAVVTSSILYLRLGHPYLARGVVGDLVGFAVLGGVLAAGGRRARHESLVCFAGIGAVWAARPDWPLRLSSGFWWAAIVLGLSAYVAARQRTLA
jgi:hypothetical protein